MTLLVGCAQPASTFATETAALGHDAAASGGNPAPLRAAGTAPAAAPATGALSAAPATAVRDLLPGLYGLDRLASSASGDTVTIRAHRPCEQVLDELQAGQWTLQSVPADQNALGVMFGLMSYGDRLATLYLKDGDGSCTGSLTASSPADLAVGGALVASSTGTELPLYCHVGPDPGGEDLTDLQLAYFGLFRTPSGSFVVNLSGRATVGTNTLDGGDEGDQGIMVLPIKPDVAPVDAALNFIGKFFGTGDDVNTAFADFAGAFTGTGTLTVTSTDPLTATLTTDTLAAYDGSDEDPGGADAADDESNDLAQYGGQTLTVTASLHCAQ